MNLGKLVADAAVAHYHYVATQGLLDRQISDGSRYQGVAETEQQNSEASFQERVNSLLVGCRELGLEVKEGKTLESNYFNALTAAQQHLNSAPAA